MKKLIAILLVICSARFALARDITLPHSEMFVNAASITDVIYLTSGNGGAVSWQSLAPQYVGDNGGSVRLDLPTIPIAGGINGGHCAVGDFQNFSANHFRVRIIMKVGTTVADTVRDWSDPPAKGQGGSTVNKFADIHGGAGNTTRVGLFSFLFCVASNTYEPAIMNPGPQTYHYYGGGNTPCPVGALHFGDGASANDYAGQVICFEYYAGPTSASLHVTTQDGVYNDTEYLTIATTRPELVSKLYVGGYNNGHHPNPDSNTFIDIYEIIIQDSATPIGPPAGFVTGGGSPGSRIQRGAGCGGGGAGSAGS